MSSCRFGFVVASFGLCVVGLPTAAAATDVMWNGAEGAYLNDGANWGEGTSGDPKDWTSELTMRFRRDDAGAYTVRLREDLDVAGTWNFQPDPNTTVTKVLFDLCGHTLNFRTAYSHPYQRYFTQIVSNGTLSCVNGSTTNSVNYWSANSPFTLDIAKGGRFVGNVTFSDNGSKYLNLHDGGELIGSFGTYGNQSRVTINHATLDGCGWGAFHLGGVNSGDASHYTCGGSFVTGIVENATIKGLKYLGVGGEPHSWNHWYSVGSYLCLSNSRLEMVGKSSAVVGIAHCGIYSRGGDLAWGNRMDVIGGSYCLWGGANGDQGYYSGVGYGYSHSNLLYVAGEGTVFTNPHCCNADYLLISGPYGIGNEIRFTDKAWAYSQSISAGGQRKDYGDYCVTSVWNRVTVDKGATLRCDVAYVGVRHADDYDSATYLTSLVASNVFAFTDGGIGEVTDVYVGSLRPSFANRFEVRGEGSRVDIARNLWVGNGGSWGNEFIVKDGGRITFSGNGSVCIGMSNDSSKDGGSSNNVIRIDGCAVTNHNYLTVGNYRNCGNSLWVGDGASVCFDTIRLLGTDPHVIVSNGILRTNNSFAPTTRDSAGENLTCRARFDFYGAQAKLLNASGNGTDYTNGVVLTFHVPVGGYASAPMESVSCPITLCDDTVFAFDFKEMLKGSHGVRNMPLISYTGGNDVGGRIRMSDELVARVNAAAVAAHPRARVKLTADKKNLLLTVNTAGLVILCR